MQTARHLLALVALAFASIGAAPAQTIPVDALQGPDWDQEWRAMFGSPAGLEAPVFDAVVFDDGSGPAVYLSTATQLHDGEQLPSLLRWDGSELTTVGADLVQWKASYITSRLLTFDDGSGPVLLVASPSFRVRDGNGVFVDCHIARWDGSAWTALPNVPTTAPGSSTAQNLRVSAITEERTSTGVRLVAGVSFNFGFASYPTDPQPWGSFPPVWRFDGTSWTPTPNVVARDCGVASVRSITLPDQTTRLAVAIPFAIYFDTPPGPFTPFPNVRYLFHDGTKWVPSSEALGFWGLEVIDIGGVETLVLLSRRMVNGVDSLAVDTFDGSTFATLGVMPANGTTGQFALDIVDRGQGPRIVVTGPFEPVPGLAATGLIEWDGSSWSSLTTADFTGAVRDVIAFDHDGQGPDLHLFGDFDASNGVELGNVARLEAGEPVPLIAEVPPRAIDGAVTAIGGFDDGTGTKLIVAGNFTEVAGVAANGIAQWDGASWAPLGGGFPGGTVYSLLVFDDGSGSKLYAGGAFLESWGCPGNCIARWDGTSWSRLGSGMDATVRDLCVHDDGSGAALWVGGQFVFADGVIAPFVTKWNGTTFEALPSYPNTSVSALCSYDSGSGANLYAAGIFFKVGTQFVKSPIRWDGTDWHELSNSIYSGGVELVVHDDGNGEQLYLSRANGFLNGQVSSNNVVSWNGTAWTELPALADGTPSKADFLLSADLGDGAALYATDANGGFIRRWKGGPGWETFGAPTSLPYPVPTTPTPPAPVVSALALVDLGGGPDLFVGGSFTNSPAGDPFLARFARGPLDYVRVSGCHANPARHVEPASDAHIGTSIELVVESAALTSGVAATYYGVADVDGLGCGVFVPGLGEILLGVAPFPVFHSLTAFAGGVARIEVHVPPVAGLVGLRPCFQSALVDGVSPGELSDGLEVVILP